MGFTPNVQFEKRLFFYYSLINSVYWKVNNLSNSFFSLRVGKFVMVSYYYGTQLKQRRYIQIAEGLFKAN